MFYSPCFCRKTRVTGGYSSPAAPYWQVQCSGSCACCTFKYVSENWAKQQKVFKKPWRLVLQKGSFDILTGGRLLTHETNLAFWGAKKLYVYESLKIRLFSSEHVNNSWRHFVELADFQINIIGSTRRHDYQHNGYYMLSVAVYIILSSVAAKIIARILNDIK